MPKQLYKITQFHGGLNSNSDARDIAESELSEATDVMVDELGKIRMMGGLAQHYNYTNSANNPNNAAIIEPGYGLFQFSHDRTEGESAGDTSPETGDDYLAMVDATNKNVDIYSRVTNAWGTAKITLGTTAGAKAAFYAVDGALRVSDGNFGAANETMWYGYIYRRFFGDGTTGYDGTGHTNGLLKTKWHADEAAPKALSIYTVQGGQATHEIPTAANPVLIDIDAQPGPTNSDEFYTNVYITKDATAGVHCIQAQVNWSHTYKHIKSYDTTYDGYENFCEIGDRIMVSGADVSSNNKIYTVTAVADDDITVAEATDTTDANDVIFMYNLSRSGWYNRDHEGFEIAISTLYDDSKQESALSKFELTGAQDSGSDSDTVMTDTDDKSHGGAEFTADNLIGFMCKNLTDGSEGKILDNAADTLTLDDLTGGSDNSWDNADVYSVSVIRPDGICSAARHFRSLRFRIKVFAGDGTNDGISVTHPRVSGFKIYMRRENTKSWYLQYEVDISKGLREPGEIYAMWGDAEFGTEIASALGDFKLSMREVETYESEVGSSSEYPSVGFDGTGTGFKTAVVANRMAYVGNVKIKDKQGNITVHGDAVLKSSVNKFDSFTLDRIIEASVNDGDSIVKLEAYADRLLIFKKNKMELVNISQEVEFLEDTFMHKGVSHPAATCKTDFGIAWVNSQGCYLYDGQKVNNLLEKQGRQIIKESLWATFTTNEPIIGYIPKKRQLLVADDNSATGTGKTFLYDIVTQSWVKGADVTITSNELTNFITDWNGDLIYAHTDGAGTVVKWSDASEASAAVALTSKDIDFGNPGQLKNIYKVYLTYRGNATHVQLHYGVDGLAPALTFNSITSGTDGSSTGSGTAAKSIPYDAGVTDWLKAELKPSAVISNINSFRLKLSGDGSNAISSDFEINDITVVYRLKGAR